jgi:hypothetical protein
MYRVTNRAHHLQNDGHGDVGVGETVEEVVAAGERRTQLLECRAQRTAGRGYVGAELVLPAQEGAGGAGRGPDHGCSAMRMTPGTEGGKISLVAPGTSLRRATTRTRPAANAASLRAFQTAMSAARSAGNSGVPFPVTLRPLRDRERVAIDRAVGQERRRADRR